MKVKRTMFYKGKNDKGHWRVISFVCAFIKKNIILSKFFIKAPYFIGCDVITSPGVAFKSTYYLSTARWRCESWQRGTWAACRGILILVTMSFCIKFSFLFQLAGFNGHPGNNRSEQLAAPILYIAFWAVKLWKYLFNFYLFQLC